MSSGLLIDLLAVMAVVGQRDDLVFGLVVVALGEFGKQLALAIGLPVIEVAQDERRAGDAERLGRRRGKIDAGVDDIDRAEAKSLIDLVLVAELRRREHLDLIFAVGAFLDFVGRPQRLGVVGLGDLIDMSPLQLGLGRGRPRDGGRDDECCRQCGAASPDGHDSSPCVDRGPYRAFCRQRRRYGPRMQVEAVPT